MPQPFESVSCAGAAKAPLAKLTDAAPTCCLRDVSIRSAHLGAWLTATVLAVLLPLPTRLDVLPCMHLGGRSEDGNEVSMSTHLDPQHAEPRLRAVECHALNKTVQRLTSVVNRTPLPPQLGAVNVNWPVLVVEVELVAPEITAYAKRSAEKRHIMAKSTEPSS